MTHPSSLDLDFVALGSGRAEVVAHVDSCERCQTHVAQSTPTLEVAPAWAQVAPRPRFGLSWGLGLAFATAMALLVVFVRPMPNEPSTRAKGQPSFAVWVVRPEATTLWDGRSPLRSGDRLQLRLASAGFTQLVVGVEQGGHWEQLFEGPVNAEGETQLPQSWLVDDHDAVMRLGVLLCDGPCGEVPLLQVAREKPRAAARWWSEFSFKVGSAP